jgi:alkylation response protein AidB-like acyl-CoA dehydrogenase
MVKLDPGIQEKLDVIGTEVVAAHALAVDQEGAFPKASMDALAAAGLYGLISAREVGGMGQGPGAAALAVMRVARECGSTGMVLAMHYAGTAVIENYGDEAVRRDIATGQHLSTLAFSEAGSRSHFWAPTSTAKAAGAQVALDAEKSWVTSAVQATAYVWSSRPVRAEDASTSRPTRRASRRRDRTTDWVFGAMIRGRSPPRGSRSRSRSASERTAKGSRS